MSMSSIALPVPRIAASPTASGSPASVMTHRLWSASISRSSTYTPGTLLIACTIASTLAASRPSEKFGTHSISRFIVWFRLSVLGDRHDCPRLAMRILVSVPHVDNLAAFHSHPAALHPEIIGNFPIILHLEDRQVRLFTGLQ